MPDISPDPALTTNHAERFARIALGHVTREYPNKLDHVLAGPEELRSPRDLHPIFFGSFDWHSCVHAYWMLARVLRRAPGMAAAPAVRALFDAQITPDKVAGELAYLARPHARGFERPYGWAWLLMLQAELTRHDAPWAGVLAPLADAFAARLLGFLPRATYPIRTGSHANTAFALILAMEYARACARPDVAAAVTAQARAWYLADAACPAWEPGGDDFLSPALVEAECMRRALPSAEFLPWLDSFLPGLVRDVPATLFRPAIVSDRSDGKIAHLDGLNLSRAWCLRRLATALPADDPRRSPMRRAVRAHLDAAMPHVAGDYAGEHWLATYAVLALDAG